MVYRLTKQRQRGPVAYDRHVYFVDFQNLCRKCKSPTWFRYKFFIIYNKLIYSLLFVCVLISFFHKLSAWYATLYKNSFPDIITTDLSIYTQSWPCPSPLLLNTDQCPKRYAILDIENYTFGSNRFNIFSLYMIFLHGKSYLGYRNGWTKILNPVWMIRKIQNVTWLMEHDEISVL